MHWIVGGMKWIMLISGVLTCTMLYAAISPRAAMRSTFGVSLDGPVADIVVRNWGVLIGLVGAMLLYGAFNIAARPLILTVAGASKVVFIGLILILGRQFLGYQAGVAVVSDVIQISLFAAYLIVVRRADRADV